MDTIEKAIQRLGQNKRGQPRSTNAPTAQNLFERADKYLVDSHAAAAKETKARFNGQRNQQRPVVGVEKNFQDQRADIVNRIKAPDSSDDLKRFIELDFERIRQSGMVVPDEQRSRIKEEYRHIKRPLLMNAAGKSAMQAEFPNLIMVTSAQPGEGKTFTATNLAMSIADERDRTVLLVDADVVRPSLSKLVGLTSGPGLVDYLVDDSLAINDLLVATNVPSLTILPAGNSHHLSTELLASKNMRELAHSMSTNQPERIVIFDSPPLLSTSEASVLATLVGQVIMVVEAGKTRQARVKDAIAHLDPDMTIGFVLNKARNTFGSEYYGYGYGYYYGDSTNQ